MRQAMTPAERSAKAAAKRKAKGAEDVRLTVMQGTKQVIAELMQRHGFTEQGELITLLLHNVHAPPDEQAAPLLTVPRHEYTINENVARNAYRAGAKQARELDSAEQ